MPTTTVQTLLDQDLVTRARAKAAREGKTLEQIVGEFIQGYAANGQTAPQGPTDQPAPAVISPLDIDEPLGPDSQPGAPVAPVTYTVKAGDSLWKIAAKFYGDGNKYSLIADANDINEKKPVYAGMRLSIPPLPPETASGRGIIPQGGMAPKPGYPMLPDGVKQLKQVFGNFTYIEIKANPVGRIQIDPKWVAANIVTTSVPSLGSVQCHKLIAPALVNVFKALQAQGLAKSLEYFGCFFPRHKMWNPAKQLSVHSWGVAIDLNAETNKVGTAGNMDVRVIRVFAEHGFYWGGNFGDPMHFQYCLGY